MKKFLLSLAALAAFAPAFAVTELNANDATAVDGTHFDAKYKDDGSVQEAEKYQPLNSLEINGYKFAFAKGGGSSDPAYYFATTEGGQKTIRAYKNNTMKLVAPEGVSMSKVEFTLSTAAKGGSINADNVSSTISSDNKVITYVASAPANAFDFTIGAGANVRIAKVSIYADGEGGGEVTPPAEGTLFESTFADGIGDFTIDNVTLPEGLTYVWNHNSQYKYMQASAYAGGKNYAAEAVLISPVFDASKATKIALSFEQVWNFFADIETAKTQAVVMARVKGGEWQALSVPTVPEKLGCDFAASGDIDLSAYVGKQFEVGFRYVSTAEKAGTWRVKNFKLTGEGTLTTEAPEVKPTEVADIKAFLDGKDTNVTYKFTNPVTVVYQNGQRLFVQDATGSLLIFGNVGQTYAKGDVIPAGFTGKYALFGGAAQLSSPADFAASTTTAAVQMEEIAVEELATDMVITYVKLAGVTITEGEKAKYYVAEQDGATVTLYDQFGVNPAVGENLNVVGIVSVYNGALQVYPIEVTDESGVVVERVAAPVFTPGAGAVIAGTKVSIATTTEGASIHYTVDGTEPTADSALYTEPIEVSEAMTIKAIAVKEGAENSEVVVAEYTIREAGAYKGDFDSFNNATANNKYGTYTNATGWTAENAAILSGNEEGAKDNNPMFAFIGDQYTLAPTLNGKTSAPGKLTSSVLTGGIGTLTFDYGFAFADRQVKLKIQILDAEGKEVASDVLEKTGLEKQTAYSYSHDFNQAGDFKVVITNECLTGTEDKNVDRVSIWHLTWTGYTSGVDNVVVEDADAPAEYFNLQGVRVAAPEAGIFIRRQGNKVEKVVIR